MRPSLALNEIQAAIHCARDYELLAPQFIAEPIHAHLVGGSAHDVTAEANLEAFATLTITPRLLRDVRAGHTRVAFPDRERPHPIFLAPLAHQVLFHALGEIETARAAGATDSCMICSTLSSCSLEDIGAVAGPDRWFQLYVQPQREVTLDLMRRAEAAGYGAIVITLDAPVQTPSLRALRAGFDPAVCYAANLAGYPKSIPAATPAGQSRILQALMRDAPVWDDLAWLMSQTSLPVWIKGVLHSDDARALMERGITGLIVSNHGGRTLDGAPASLHVLPAIRAAVGPNFPVLLDSGIRSGTDIFKAIARGADGVLIGRLQAFALSVGGALGVAHMIKLLREELELCMALAGCATLLDVRSATLGDGTVGAQV